MVQRREQRAWAEVYLRGLLTADVPRKKVKALGLRLLGAGPAADRQGRALQQFVGEGGWDDAALLAAHQRLVDETLGEADGGLIIDGSEVPKQGTHSVGVARQWCGHSGKTDNCQAGVSLGYASRQGYTLLDRRLYLPAAWFTAESRARWRACAIPRGPAFQTKHELAGAMVEDLVAARRVRARWVVCDEDYGDSPALLDRWAGLNLGYLAEVARDTQLWFLTEPDGQPRRDRGPRAGCRRRRLRAEGRSRPGHACTRPARHPSGWTTGPRRCRRRPGGATGSWKGPKGRWGPTSSRCGSSPCATACPAPRGGCWAGAPWGIRRSHRRTNTT